MFKHESIKLDGKKIMEERLEIIKEHIDNNFYTNKIKLTIIQIGDNDASNTYINNKQKACEKVGINCLLLKFRELSFSDLKRLIEMLNKDKSVHGILVQFPLPKELDEHRQEILDLIDENKDVDKLSLVSLGKLMCHDYSNAPCTPEGIIDLLSYYEISIENKTVLILNRTNIVGNTLAQLILKYNGTPIICHSKTDKKFIKTMLKKADIIVSAMGKANYITHRDIGKNQVLIDVSMNRDENNKLCGDFTKKAYSKSSYYAPVPGSTGPMTIFNLINNVYCSYEKLNK